MPTPLLAEQVAYYRARAHEYDEWWQRRGRYDRGPEATQQWRAEVQEVERALARFAPMGHVLELAGGTGWWTQHLATTAASLTCIDASPETIAINRQRLIDANLPLPTYIEADIFEWRPSERYDIVFFSFWLSHVPADRFDAFWRTVTAALKPNGRVFFVDNARPLQTGAPGADWMPDDDGIQKRTLNDGRTFRIVKLFYEPDELAARLKHLGWRATCAATERYLLYGEASAE
jgi:demethylmenaquinone methyltransferase/2-methoxy-6-polyprenyl-1,4-benzoquinol methylase